MKGGRAGGEGGGRHLKVVLVLVGQKMHVTVPKVCCVHQAIVQAGGGRRV